MKEFDDAFSKCDEFDQRNLGIVIGMILLGRIEFFNLHQQMVLEVEFQECSEVIRQEREQKIIYKRNKISKRLIFMIQEQKLQQMKYNYNLNLQRFVIDKILTEIKVALNFRYDAIINQTQFQKLLEKTIVLLNQDLCSIEIKFIIINITIVYKIKIFIQQENKLINEYSHYKNLLEISVLKGIEMLQKQLALYLKINYLIINYLKQLKRLQKSFIQLKLFYYLINSLIHKRVSIIQKC
ncbi:unnamed protein product [Paramecium sonneborni]|uniref:Uncharacterized protein n=1 Tax=Paramecium sonneborni TaxID=65129 RepID=A0A8S1RMU7_9CILI|nr:unnamed protein product [Paramecium sonneborni]